jgi:hypothetical protein
LGFSFSLFPWRETKKKNNNKKKKINRKKNKEHEIIIIKFEYISIQMKMEKRPALVARVLKRRVEVQISGKALIDYVQRHYVLVYSVWYNLSVEKSKRSKRRDWRVKTTMGTKGDEEGRAKAICI